ncbi:MAG: ATP-binding cassette domain-containing protein [Trueperaceae bacterium]
MAQPLLTATGLGRLVDDRWLWRDLELALAPGETLAVTGGSGSGKTLLLRALAGLDPADAGEVALDGLPQDGWSMPTYRAQVRYLPQKPVTIEGSVEDGLRFAFGLRVHRGATFSRPRALDLLERVGRDERFLAAQSASLSGGEGQLVALVRALLLPPRVLLLDEPTASLDDATARDVEALVADWLAGADDRAVIWTSHRDEQLARVSRRRLELGGTT